MKKTGIVFGLNYIGKPYELYGCINDVTLMAKLLTDKFGYSGIKIFTDNTPIKPTRQVIIREITNLIAESINYDEIFIHYSGHGGQIRDSNDDEIDRLDEAIFPLDFGASGIIKDDDLLAIIKNSKCEVKTIFDSCHSGSVLDIPYQVEFRSLVPTISMQKTDFVTQNGKKIVCISGSIDGQVSYDSNNPLNGKSMGALTCELYNKWSVDPFCQISTLMLTVRDGLAKKKLPQRPIVSSNQTILPTDSFFLLKPPEPVLPPVVSSTIPPRPNSRISSLSIFAKLKKQKTYN